MNVTELQAALPIEHARRPYFLRLEIIEQSVSLLKARIYISSTLFIQIYRNDKFETTNLALISDNYRIFAHDQLGGKWHRHQYTDPEAHDTSPAGKRAVTLSDFLDEVEALLAQLDLP